MTQLQRGFQPTPGRQIAVRLVAGAVTVSAGLALFAFAWFADRAWLDRHFLPSYFISRHTYVVVLQVARMSAATVATFITFYLRPRIARWAAQVSWPDFIDWAMPILIALIFALGATELVLRRTFRHSANEVLADEEPQRRSDARLGWVFVPNRTGRDTLNGRAIEYSFDANGYRVRQLGDTVDFEKPTFVFTGESIMVGHGLNWAETIPAQVESVLGIQCANIAVHGYSNDQAYFRLEGELPKFRHPLAIVTLFSPALFNRNLDLDRPHLGPGSAWEAPESRWRLSLIASILVPYRSEEEIVRGIAATQNDLRAVERLAQSHGAAPFCIVPHFDSGPPQEKEIVTEIFGNNSIPYTFLPLDAAWRIPHDLHPDPRATHAMALAIAEHLRGQIGNSK